MAKNNLVRLEMSRADALRAFWALALAQHSCRSRALRVSVDDSERRSWAEAADSLLPIVEALARQISCLSDVPLTGGPVGRGGRARPSRPVGPGV